MWIVATRGLEPRAGPRYSHTAGGTYDGPRRPVKLPGPGGRPRWSGGLVRAAAQQSLSVAALQPVGQQKSDLEPEQVVIGTCRQAASQWAGSPVSCSFVQGSPSSGQVVGQVVGGSQVSPAPIRPSPQTGWQSESVAALQPGGQQPSSSRQAVSASCWQARVQPATDPDARSTVQASASSQEWAQLPGIPAVIARSHCSPASTTPSPQTTGQSESVVAVQPAGQQPSPPMQRVIGVATQLAVQEAGEPRSATVVHDPAAGQALWQESPPAA